MLYTEHEAVVGHFGVVMSNNNKYYCVRYLNLLIHGILTALEDYEKIIKVKQWGAMKNFLDAEKPLKEILKLLEKEVNIETLGNADDLIP